MTARSLTTAQSWTFTAPPARRDAAGELTREGGDVGVEALPRAASVEAGDLDHGTPLDSTDSDPDATWTDEEGAEQAENRSEYAAQRDPLSRAVADLQLHPPLPAVELDGSEPAGQHLLLAR